METDQAKIKPISKQESVSKVLGLTWDKEADELQFKFDKIVQDSHMIVLTKRVILSTLATLFDPFGLISPLAVE